MHVSFLTGQAMSLCPSHGLLWMQQDAGVCAFPFIPENHKSQTHARGQVKVLVFIPNVKF